MTVTDAEVTCPHDRQLLAGHALGSLDDEDRVAVERWLATCPTCRAEFDELEKLVGLLAVARERPVAVPGRIRDAVVADAVRRRMTRRFVPVLVVCATVALLVGGVLGTAITGGPVTVTVPATADEPYGVDGAVSYEVTGEQLVVRLDLDRLPPLAEPQVYEAWLYRVDGRIVSLGQLEPVDGHVVVALPAEGTLDDYRGFWVTAEPDWRDPAHAGPTVVSATVPRL